MYPNLLLKIMTFKFTGKQPVKLEGILLKYLPEYLTILKYCTSWYASFHHGYMEPFLFFIYTKFSFNLKEKTKVTLNTVWLNF